MATKRINKKVISSSKKKVGEKNVVTTENVNVIINIIDSFLKLIRLRKKQDGKLKGEQVTNFIALVTAGVAIVLSSIKGEAVDYTAFNQIDQKLDSIILADEARIDSLENVVLELQASTEQAKLITDRFEIKGNNIVIK